MKEIYQTIIIPPSVYSELAFLENQKAILEKEDWIKPTALSDASMLPDLLKKVDKGEAEAIALAVELKADFLLIDEQTGRSVAEEYGLKITGVLGVLVQAKQQGLIPGVKICMEKLRTDAGFRIHPKLFDGILKMVGEG
ncbi:MAG: DUF3368 domain-containing protein [Saprospiraceae bacterium]